MLSLGSCNCAQAQGTATAVPRQLQPAAELRTYSQHVVFKILPLLTSFHTLIEIAHGTITVDEDILCTLGMQNQCSAIAFYLPEHP